MRTLRVGLVVVAAVVLQTTLFADVRVFDVVPDLGLLVTAAVAVREGPVAGATVGFAAGLLFDCFLSTPLGLTALAWALTGYALGLVETGMLRSTQRISPLLGLAAGLAGGLLFAAVAILAGQDHLARTHTLVVVVVAACYDALLAPLVFPLAQWAARRPGTAAAAGAWQR